MLILSIIGPGIITANVDNDAGGIATYSIAGAHFGYSLLWTLIPITVALIVVQEMCARMGVVTGKGLADLIRENFGLRATFYMMIMLLIANFCTTISNFSGVAASCELFGIKKYVSVPIGAFAIWRLIVKGTYKSVEKVFLIACLFYIAYPLSGWLAHPPWKEIFINTFKPSFSFDPNYIFTLIGVIGTTITPWMQFYLQSAIVEKGVKLDGWKYSRLDVISGCFMTDIVSWFIIATCAVTLFSHGMRIESAQDAALALQPLAGRYCSLLFAFGLLNASLFAASILPIATAFYVCEGMGWEAGVDKRFREAPQFYTLFTVIIVLGSAVVLIPNFPLLFMMVLSQVVNGMLLPFVLVFMLLLINKKKIMGKYVNSRVWNIISWCTISSIVVLSLFLVFQTFGILTPK